MPEVIAIIAPSSSPDMEYLKLGIDYIESLGHRVILSPNINARTGYCAGTAKQRADDIRWAFEEAEGNVVWMARGGYGLVHCLPELQRLAATHKTVIGSSDATLLLELLYQRGSTRLIHGPMVERLAWYSDDKSKKSVTTWLHRDPATVSMKLKSANAVSDGNQTITGPLTGGNLTVIASLCGTPLQHDAKGCILLLEDVKEPLYRIDRSLQQLILSGVFNRVKAIVLGEFLSCTVGSDVMVDIIPKIIDILMPLQIPIYYDGPFGHGKHNISWPYRKNGEIRNNCLYF